MADEKKSREEPIPEENESKEKETTPLTEDKKATVPVKFNKEIRELSLEEASVLAQKGLKFEAIEKEYNSLKELSAKESKSVPQFLKDLSHRLSGEKLKDLKEKCGGDEEIALRLLELDGKADNGLEELKEAFPEIKSIEDLPQEVKEKSELKGTLLLDEYLRFLLSQEKMAKNARKEERKATSASTGSLSSNKGAINAEAQSFLNGLWQ